MDIIAAIVAYLTCVSAIAGALAIAAFAFFAAPEPTAPPHLAAVMAKSTSMTKSTSINKPTSDIRTAEATAATAAVPRHKTTPQRTRRTTLHTRLARIERNETIIAAGRSQDVARLFFPSRPLPQQTRARQLAYQQNSSFETRFLNFAD